MPLAACCRFEPYKPGRFMGTSQLLEVGTILGSILGVWFALVGWKLVPLIREGRSRPAEGEFESSVNYTGLQLATRAARDATRG